MEQVGSRHNGSLQVEWEEVVVAEDDEVGRLLKPLAKLAKNGFNDGLERVGGTGI